MIWPQFKWWFEAIAGMFIKSWQNIPNVFNIIYFKIWGENIRFKAIWISRIRKTNWMNRIENSLGVRLTLSFDENNQFRENCCIKFFSRKTQAHYIIVRVLVLRWAYFNMIGLFVSTNDAKHFVFLFLKIQNMKIENETSTNRSDDHFRNFLLLLSIKPIRCDIIFI